MRVVKYEISGYHGAISLVRLASQNSGFAFQGSKHAQSEVRGDGYMTEL
jgi:hypothetical protein